MKTFSAKATEVDRKWWIIDAADQIVGQVAVEAARLLRGKHKAIFTPHADTGDFVVIINAEKARFSGNKEEQKVYSSYSGYVGGQKEESPKKLRARRPERILELAVKGMIPHNRLGRQIYQASLKFIPVPSIPHEAQSPEALCLRLIAHFRTDSTVGAPSPPFFPKS